MDNTTTIVVVAVAVLALLAVVWMVMQQRRRAHLKDRFGPEYAQALRQHPDARTAERELLDRERRVATFAIKPLTREDATRFSDAWRVIQSRFVDDPKGAVVDADRLVDEVMRTRGYPIADFEQRAADISVDHPRVVANYRSARVIAGRNTRGETNTEELRQALVHYRELFADLLEIREEDRRVEPVVRAKAAGAGGRR
jgi:FtsZ-interacting cell division protein ZipA